MQVSIKGRCSSAAFTLIELLLVVVIVGVLVGVAMPSMVESIRWHRLQTASRTLVTAARYARSMAILKQSDLTISFNLDTGQVDTIAANSSIPRSTSILTGVALEYVEPEGMSRVTEGVCSIRYSRNGTCHPFAIKVRDMHDNYILVKVDALSSVRTRESGKE